MVDRFEDAEQVTGTVDGQHGLAAVESDETDLGAAGDEQEHGVAVVALDDEVCASRVAAGMPGTGQLSAVSGVEPARKPPAGDSVDVPATRGG